jgi:Flp pilus assembly protein TadG
MKWKLASVAALRDDRRGVAAIEFAFFAGMLAVAILNVVDLAMYMYKRMEVENAAQSGTIAAWKTCGLAQLPATSNCPGLNNAVTTAIQGTSLGTGITLQNASPSEGYYCLNASNLLQYVSNVSSPPADCSAAGVPGNQPGDYLQVAVTYTYTPLFAGLSIAGGFTTPLTKTAWIRMK